MISFKFSATTEDILAFQRALNVLRSEFPFSAGFGLVDSRQSCLEASNAMFERLQSRQGSNYDFIFVKEIIAALSSNNGTKDEFKKEELRNLLHPDKRGKLSRLDFVTVRCTPNILALLVFISHYSVDVYRAWIESMLI